ncbi:MAG: sensor histidine kinase [Actinomycetota bacterium]
MPLALKLLLPYLVLGLIVGTVGTSLIVRQLSGQALSHLDQELRQRTLDERAALHDRELYLLEAGNFAANISGLANAVNSGNTVTVQRLTDSVAALKSDLGLIAIVNPAGHAVYSLTRAPGQQVFQTAPALAWMQEPIFSQALRSATGSSSPGLITTPTATLFAMATPICTSRVACNSAGVAVVALDARDVISSLVGSTPARNFSVSLLDLSGRTLAQAGSYQPAGTPPSDIATGDLRRVISGSGTKEFATLYAELSLGDKPAAILAVTQSAAPFLTGVRDTSHKLLAILVLTTIGIAIIGFVLARLILGQLRPLLATSRELGAGKLDARVPVRANDELGELANAVNEMAEQLEVSYATLETRVDERTEEIHRLLKDRNEFFAGLSHELRTPIAVIARQADLILTSRVSRKRVDPHQVAGTIKDSASQLLSVVNQILELARADAGRLELKIADVSINELLDDLKPTLDRVSSAAGIRATIDSAENLVALADPLRLRHVILNLVDNAVKYTPSGGKVSVRASAVEDGVEIAVSDTGIGIPEEGRDRLFEPFSRFDGNTTQHGEASSGLGLALAKRLVVAQGGFIECESTVGKGSTFTVRLPRSATPAATTEHKRMNETKHPKIALSTAR